MDAQSEDFGGRRPLAGAKNERRGNTLNLGIALGLPIIVLVAMGGCVMPVPTRAPTPSTLPVRATFSPTPTVSRAPTNTAALTPTETRVSPTETPTQSAAATAAFAPPTTTPVPPTATPRPATHTVCAAGCDFTAIQAAIDTLGIAQPTVDDPGGGAIVEVTDTVHTEPGIVFGSGSDITIRGLGADQTIVQAHETLDGSPERVFLVEEGACVVLEGMTIRHGTPSAEEEHGGGIDNHGRLLIRNCTVTKNSARGGGGISNRNGDLTIVGSTCSDNVARGDGPRGVECGGGGGVKSSSGRLTLVGSTITGNRAGLRSEGLGGGVRTGCACVSEIVNTTVSGNQAARYGGGIAASGSVTITHCTIVDNRVGPGGGGLWVRGKVAIENTIIARNRGGANCTIGGEGGHVGTGSIILNRNTWIGDGSCSPDFSGDPMLSHLDDNGGETLTHALLPGSPAIDAIPAASCTVPTDQRGLPRPTVQTSADTPCDVGAFEVQPEP